MRTRAVILALIATLAAGAIGESAVAKKPKNRLRSFSDCEALIQYGKRHVAKEKRASAGPARGEPSPDDFEGPAAPSAGEGDGEDSSTTNVQEAGIDEPDVVKSKGSRIFALAGGALHAVGTGEEEPRLLDTLKLDGWGQQLLLRDDRVLIIGYEYGDIAQPGPGGTEPGTAEPGTAGPRAADVIGVPYYDPKTVLTEVDISDAGDLRVVRTEKIDGIYLTARQNGETARIVVSSVPRAVAEPALRESAAGWRPRSTLTKKRSGKRRTRALTSCRRTLRPSVFSGLDTLTVLTVDLSKGLPAVDADAILTSGELAYASKNNLYVATQRWVEAPESSDEPPPSLSTALHKFDASEPGATRYDASGKVRGTLLSQWSFSDHEGTLRVASTDSPLWWNGPPQDESESFVTTFREREGKLEQAGQVGGLGRGERIYAVRFMGDVGYVVTFRQVDPLYTLDLSDFENPRVVGELKVRGYSAYLHPIGGDLLLGVGQDATDEGAALGTQLSLFDVGNPAKPVRLHARAVEGGSSDVEYDHHAFLWWGPSKLAVLPIQVWDYEKGGDPFMGAVGFNVARDSGIDEAGRTAHEGGYESRITRSLVVKGRLFTLSESGVAMNSMKDLSGEGWVPFPAP